MLGESDDDDGFEELWMMKKPGIFKYNKLLEVISWCEHYMWICKKILVFQSKVGRALHMGFYCIHNMMLPIM